MGALVTICPTCAQPWGQDDLLDTQEEYKRGAFLARTCPAEVFYRGLRLPLTPREAVFLALMVRRGAISRFAAEMTAAGPNARSYKIVDVVICKLRRKLRDADPALKNAIVTVHSVGFRLEMVQ